MKQKILLAAISLTMMGFVMGGCARVGVAFDSSSVEKIRLNETTKDDIITMLGEPWRKGLEDGYVMWTYGHYTYRLFGDSDTKDLVVKFTKEGKVKSYTFNKTKDAK